MCGGRAWRLAGLSSALAFPLDLGARPLCRRLRGRVQYSCLEKPVDRGAWRATVYEVAKSQTWPGMLQSMGSHATPLTAAC